MSLKARTFLTPTVMNVINKLLETHITCWLSCRVYDFLWSTATLDLEFWFLPPQPPAPPSFPLSVRYIAL